MILKKITFLTACALISAHLSAQVNDPDPTRFSSQINAFDSLDNCYLPQGDIVLFVGSSSFRMWKDAADVFSKYNAVNRGFGGSHFNDVHHYFDALIKKYSPKTLLLYEGDNDVAHGKSPDRVLHDFKKLVEKMKSETTVENIALVSIKPSPARWNISNKMIDANNRMKEYCESQSGVSFIDIWPLMLDARGKPDNQLYIGDGIHMNHCGYKLWEKKFLEYLENLPE